MHAWFAFAHALGSIGLLVLLKFIHLLVLRQTYVLGNVQLVVFVSVLGVLLIPERLLYA
jgi:hypothetical protein